MTESLAGSQENVAGRAGCLSNRSQCSHIAQGPAILCHPLDPVVQSKNQKQMLCSTNRPTSVRLTGDLQPRPGLRSGKAELRKARGPERMNICPFDALSPLFLPNSLVCPPLLFWEALRAYCPLIFVDSLPRARFCNSLVALKSNRTGAACIGHDGEHAPKQNAMQQEGPHFPWSRQQTRAFVAEWC
jgi:hypothetical protein